MEFNLLQEQNPWWKTKEWSKQDRQLVEFGQAKFRYSSPIIKQFDLNQDNIYLLYGPRQVGKSTLLKLLIEKELSKSHPFDVFYYLCDFIEDKKALSDLMRTYLDWRGQESLNRKLVVLDEISAVSNFSVAIKHLVDLGLLKNTTLILSGSNSVKIKRSGEFMPGRRGGANKLDFVLLPLSFREFVLLQEGSSQLAKILKQIKIDCFTDFYKYSENEWKGLQLHQQKLQAYLKKYLLTGGFLKTLNSLEAQGEIPDNVYLTYKHWLISDLAKLEKKDTFFLEIVRYLLKTVATPISFVQIAQETNIGSHNTVIDYLEIMQDSFIVDQLYFLDTSKNRPAFKKNKKIYFKDPFLFFLIYYWSKGVEYNIYQQSVQLAAQDQLLPHLVESMAVNHFSRFSNRIFYSRQGSTEIDIVGLERGLDRKFACEVKYQNTIQKSDLRGLSNFKHKLLLSKKHLGKMDDTLILPLEVGLAALEV